MIGILCTTIALGCVLGLVLGLLTAKKIADIDPEGRK